MSHGRRAGDSEKWVGERVAALPVSVHVPVMRNP